jgi:uncharacterized damage-inducible protein DinB
MATATLPTIAESLSREIEQEGANTRKLLERIPWDKTSFKPHEKSMSLLQLASHIAEVNSWAETIVKEDVFVLDMSQYKPPVYANKEELVAFFDKALADCLKALKGVEDKTMHATWTMQDPQGNVMVSGPRTGVLRAWVISHLIHHRAQLGVYLRLLDVPLSTVYGPTADEGKMAGCD